MGYSEHTYLFIGRCFRSTFLLFTPLQTIKITSLSARCGLYHQHRASSFKVVEALCCSSLATCSTWSC